MKAEGLFVISLCEKCVNANRAVDISAMRRQSSDRYPALSGRYSNSESMKEKYLYAKGGA